MLRGAFGRLCGCEDKRQPGVSARRVAVFVADDANDRRSAAVDADLPAERGRVGAKPAVPEPMAQENRVVVARRLRIGREEAPGHGRDTEHWEKVGGGSHGFDPLRIGPGTRNDGRLRTPARQTRKRSGAAAGVEKVGDCDRVSLMRTFPRPGIPHEQQLLQLRVRIGVPQQAVEKTERDDREGQRDRQGPNDRECQARGPGEALESKTHVQPDVRPLRAVR